MKPKNNKEDVRRRESSERYNPLCEQCTKDCKQLATVQVIYCPNYLCRSSVRDV